MILIEYIAWGAATAGIGLGIFAGLCVLRSWYEDWRNAWPGDDNAHLS